MTKLGNLPEVVSREEWLAARNELLAKEKELTRARDRLNADRRRLPMVRIDKPYVFEGPDGTVGLLDLFEGRPQLVMHHFMFSPDWDQACSSCSSAADGIGRLRQLHVRNTTLVAVSRAPYEKIAAFRERMGWAFPWYPRTAATSTTTFTRPSTIGSCRCAAPPQRGRTRRGRHPVDGRPVDAGHARRGTARHQRFPASR